jgi:hypothetical protein
MMEWTKDSERSPLELYNIDLVEVKQIKTHKVMTQNVQKHEIGEKK